MPPSDLKTQPLHKTKPLHLLQIGPISERFNRRLAASYPVTPLWQQDQPGDWLAHHGAGITGIVTSATQGCRAEIIASLPDLRVISSFGVGYDSIAIDEARQRGIQISNTPDILNDCVADMAFGLLIDSARRLSEADRFVRRGEWETNLFPLGRQVFGKKLGIVGLGRIGKAVAKRASGFEMKIGYHNRSADPSLPHRYFNSVVELARWADFLVLTCVGSPDTYHLISHDALEALGPEAFLINVSRGSVVDEDALIAALQAKRIAGAALDVFAHEPHVPEALRNLPNVVLAPHIASGTEETRLAMEELVFENLALFAAEGRLVTPV